MIVPGRLAAAVASIAAAFALTPFVETGAGGLAAQRDPESIGAPPAILADASAFWLSPDEDARAEARARLAAADVPVSILFAALAAPPDYRPDPALGRLDRGHRNADGRPHPYTVLVPAAYSPDRDWPVLVYLHGGIGRPAWQTPGAWWQRYDRIADAERIVVVPASWNESRWWQDSQVESLRRILDALGREYRIDRNRIHLIGMSDGGTGVYYHAFRAPSPWASFLPFIGHAAVLSNPRLGVDGQMYVSNLRNRPLFIVNGGRDRLYPTSSVEPFVRLFRTHGVPLTYRPKPEAGHDMTWIDEEGARIDSFLVATPRDPLPERVEWETEDPRGAGRFAWVRIDRLGDVPGQADLPGRNELTVNGDSTGYLAFPRRRPSGRIVAEREANVVRVETEGVSGFRLFLSPTEFDLDRPVRVEANGSVAFEGRVEPSARTLLQRAWEDQDRTMLFVAELVIDLAGRDPQ